MKRHLLIVVMLSLIFMGRLTSAQDPLPVDPKSHNAALSYWQAFALLPRIEGDVRKRLLPAASGESPVDDELRKLVASSEVSLRYLHRAVKIDACAWGIAYETGPYAYMPHLSKARELARVALLRARIRFENGDVDDAIEDLLATVQLGRHAGQEGVIVLINILVGFAIESQAIESTAFSLHRMDNAQRKKFQRRLEQIEPKLDMQQALRGEKDVFVGWLIREIENNREKDAILNLVTGDMEEAVVSRVKAASHEQLLQYAKDLSGIYDTGFGFMSLSPEVAIEQAEKLGVRLRDEETGNPLGALFLPSFGAARRAEATFMTRQALLNAAFAMALESDEVLKRPEHRDPFGDGPFQMKHVNQDLELISKMKLGDQPVTLKLPALGK